MQPSIPAVVYLSALAAGLPIMVLLVWGGRTAAHRWVLVACILSLLIDAAGLFTAMRQLNNHWVMYAFTPFFGAAIIMALAQAHRTAMARQVFTASAILLVIVSLVLAVTVENRQEFSAFASPLRSLLVLSLSLWTLLQRNLAPGAPPILRSGWFWAPLGFALYSGASVAYFPFARGMGPQNPEFVIGMAMLRAVLVIVSFVLVAWGVRCLSLQPSSGRRLSPRSSPSPSS